MKKMFRMCVFTMLCISVLGCTSREEATVDFSDPIKFNDHGSVKLPSTTTYAQKRGFGDMNGDGIDDMYEINDEVLFGTDYKVNVYKGYYDVNGIINFSEKVVTYDVPVDFKWFSSLTKIDVADVNGDGYYDIVFSQYTEGFSKDEMQLGYAINDKNNSFYKHKSKIKVGDDKTIQYLILMFIDGYSYSDDSLSDYLKMDWGDMNGDGRDDLVLMWRTYGSGNLDIEIFYSSDDNDGDNIGFSNYNSFSYDNFLYSRNIRNVDIENYTGSKAQDILVRSSFGEYLIISVLENTTNGFIPHRDFHCVTMDLDFFGFEKFDSFDIDNDGYADMIHLGEIDDNKVCVYNTVRI